MLKLSHTTRNAALAGVLAVGLAGSAGMVLMPAIGHAQDRDDGYYRDRYYRDRDDHYRGDYDDRYRRDYDARYHRYWNGRSWVGIGVPGFGIGFYDYPAYPYYGPYCDAYGYCDY